MRHELTLQIEYDDDRKQWTIGCLAQWADQIELARSSVLGPFTAPGDITHWIDSMWLAWIAPTLGQSASESLHDAYELAVTLASSGGVDAGSQPRWRR
jgi:hypothetical protein